MNTSKGFINPLWLLVVLVVIVLGGGAAYWYTQQPASRESGGSVESQMNERSQLAADVAEIDPFFVADEGELDGSLRLKLSKLEKDIRAAVDPQNDMTEISMWIQAVGKRYIAFGFATASGQADTQIIDVVTGKIVGKIPHSSDGFYAARSYFAITRQDICVYKLDTPTCVPLQGASLSGSEIYGDNEHMGGIFDPELTLTQTDTSFTITTFKFEADPRGTPEEGYPYKLKKVRELTFALPQ